jgi:transposase
LLTDEIHNDSTTITLKGKYDSLYPEGVKLKHGHNKDFRPDCKQVVFGLNITSDGHVPLMSPIFQTGIPCAPCWKKRILFTWLIVSFAARKI